MFVHKHFRATVVLTMFSIFIALTSLLLPWYRVTDAVDSDSYTRLVTTEFGIEYFDRDMVGIRDYSTYYKEVGGLTGVTVFIIVIWALVAIAYVGTIIPGTGGPLMDRWDGYTLGWALIVVSLMPAVVFATFIADSVGYSGYFVGSEGQSEWGPASGWYLVVIASAFQIIAVLARNIPAYLGDSGDTENLSPEESAHGDLPLR